MESIRTLLERELCQTSPAPPSPPAARLDATWRHRVVRWYFIVCRALDDGGRRRRAAAHVAVALLDRHLRSLPPARARRYARDRRAYRVLATTCLLLGLRLASASASTLLPGAAALLRLSAAPASVSAGHLRAAAREVTGARSFPRDGGVVVTALHFVEALRGAATRVGGGGPHAPSLALGPADAEGACRLANAALGDARLAGLRPSVVACAVVTLALARSGRVDHLGPASLRREVRRSIFGADCEPLLQAAISKAEHDLLGSIRAEAPPARNGRPAAHLIPLEEESCRPAIATCGHVPSCVGPDETFACSSRLCHAQVQDALDTVKSGT